LSYGRTMLLPTGSCDHFGYVRKDTSLGIYANIRAAAKQDNGYGEGEAASWNGITRNPADRLNVDDSGESYQEGDRK